MVQEYRFLHHISIKWRYFTEDGFAIGYQAVRNHLPFVIARQEKCLPSQVLEIRAAQGCVQRRGPSRPSVAKIAVVRRLAAEGVPLVDIAFHEDLSWQQVEKILREAEAS